MVKFEGLQEQSNRIQELLDEADKQGYLTLDQIVDAFPDAEDALPQLEEVFANLHGRDIQVYDGEEESGEAHIGTEGELDTDENGNETSGLSNIAPDETISLYFKEMSRESLLTREEEVALAKRMERGREAQRQLSQNGHEPRERAKLERIIRQGKAARQHLIAANTRLVVSIAKKYRGGGLPFLDLIQAGNLGLIRAADKYDYRRGTKFGTLATWWIRQAVVRALKKQGRTIRIPIHLSDQIRKLYRTAQRLEQDLERRPTPEEIAEEMGIEPEKARWMLQVSQPSLSLEEPVGEEEDSEFIDFIENEDLPSPARSVELHLLREDLEKMLNTLTPREVRILRMRFGLGGDRTYTLREVGERLGVSRERVRQIESEALRKLRHPRCRRRLRGYL